MSYCWKNCSVSYSDAEEHSTTAGAVGAALCFPTGRDRRRSTRERPVVLRVTWDMEQGEEAHHVFIHFLLAVDHFLLGPDQSSVLLSQCGSCVQRAQLSPEVGWRHVGLTEAADSLLRSGSPQRMPPPPALDVLLAPSLEDALCSTGMRDTGPMGAMWQEEDVVLTV